jgi:ATP-binding cassette subfamily B protein
MVCLLEADASGMFAPPLNHSRQGGSVAANRATVVEAASSVAAGDVTPKKPKSLRPLLMLRPYILRHARMLVLAGVALVISAIAMLAVPMAARRMVDRGFADRVGTFINQYFVMLIFIGLVISCASSARFFLVNWLGERVVSDVRSDVFRHLAKLGPASRRSHRARS